MELVLLAGQDADLAVLHVGAVHQLLCRGGVGLVVDLAAQGRGPRVAFGVQVAVELVEGLVAERGVKHVFFV
ncbi:hypothetical protein D3C72_2349880 [compost metagenome]